MANHEERRYRENCCSGTRGCKGPAKIEGKQAAGCKSSLLVAGLGVAGGAKAPMLSIPKKIALGSKRHKLVADT